MDSKMKNVVMLIFTGLLLAVIAPVGGPWISRANAAVVADETYGASYGEWSARWWQWLLSIPAATSPNLGGDCAQGQVDRVWFLGGAFGKESIPRTCTIPAGTPIFFPVINSVGFKPWGYETLLDLRASAKSFIDSTDSLSIEVDGNIVQSFRVTSPSFTVIAPPKGLVSPGKLSVPGNTDSIVSDGYWVLLEPLSEGAHTIHFKATTTSGFAVEVTYNLTVN